MSTLFFYGTLRHLPLLEIVLGRPVNPKNLRYGTAVGHQACAVAGGDFPLIMEGGDGAQGFAILDLTATEVQRLNFYEGGFEYELKTIQVETDTGPMPADVYFPLEGVFTALGPWDFDGWVAKWGALTCLAAQEAMSYFGKKTAEQLDFMFPTIRSRAAQKLSAQAESFALSPSGFTREDAKSVDIKNRFTGYFAMEEHTINHKNFGGSETKGIHREVFVGGDAALLLPYDKKRDRVLLVEQFRMGPWARHDPKPWMLEPIAGRIDPGETPEQSARREAKEEANLSIDRLHAIAKVYASPGCNTEFFHIFVGETELPDEAVGVAGLDTEGEDIKSYIYSFDELMEMVDRYQAANAPLVLAALWLSRHRDALRAAT